MPMPAWLVSVIQIVDSACCLSLSQKYSVSDVLLAAESQSCTLTVLHIMGCNIVIKSQVCLPLGNTKPIGLTCLCLFSIVQKASLSVGESYFFFLVAFSCQFLYPPRPSPTLPLRLNTLSVSLFRGKMKPLSHTVPLKEPQADIFSPADRPVLALTHTRLLQNS